MSTNLHATVEQLLAAGRHAEAVSLIRQQSAAGSADADYQLGLWQLAGSPIPRDLSAARRSLARAARASHPDARLIEIALTANGSGGRADWQAAVELLARAAPNDPNAAHVHRLIKAMQIDEEGKPVDSPLLTPLTHDGLVRRAASLLTAEECGHLAASVADLLQPAMVSDPRTGRSMPHPIRTSDGAVIGPVREDLVVRAINLRLAALTGTSVDAGEALTILRYRVSEQFRLHSDVLPATRNQRTTTVLVYLNDGFVGGETVFPDYDLSVTPRAGDAIVFDNVDQNGRPVQSARHAGAPVTGGVKWLATRWIRARPFDVWRGPESAP